ncbi:ribonuclease HII [Sandaracinobacter neustonicus]|uniref:Ribonuclease HII n=1 Tax=Sandaracinobacter neustonicus TaxID=1715348 RepID=A0A501XYC3_9SPHN|nr:ribonuclease HII [Sandaracinobacter neustonicus]TPE65037.1 ribonuclease HII [Sandaracinobacter neustonicus]
MAAQILIAGVDEAGRGPLAGPVVAAAVILCDDGIAGVADSKALSAKRRALLAADIRARCAVGVGQASVEEIDRLNILWASMLAMRRAVEALVASSGLSPQLVLVDGNRCPDWGWPSRAVIGGDASEPAISAASIIAKEVRDALMRDLAAAHPGYGWERNMGYGTAQHLAGLRALGVTPHHRQSFAPVKNAKALKNLKSEN